MGTLPLGGILLHGGLHSADWNPPVPHPPPVRTGIGPGSHSVPSCHFHETCFKSFYAEILGTKSTHLRWIPRVVTAELAFLRALHSSDLDEELAALKPLAALL